MKAKYILFTDDDTESGMDRVVIFDTIQRHADVARALEVKPFSAGFITLAIEISCWGEATSLGLKSHPDDDTHITRLLSL